MDNANTQGWPDAPADIPEWPFYHHLHGMRTAIGRTNAVKNQHGRARRTLLHQLKLMGNTKCAACGGYSHRARDCPTNQRLGMLGSASIQWKKLIAHARRVTDQALSERSAAFVEE